MTELEQKMQKWLDRQGKMFDQKFWDEADSDVLKNGDNPEEYIKFRQEEEETLKKVQKQINLIEGARKKNDL